MKNRQTIHFYVTILIVCVTYVSSLVRPGSVASIKHCQSNLPLYSIRSKSSFGISYINQIIRQYCNIGDTQIDSPSPVQSTKDTVQSLASDNFEISDDSPIKLPQYDHIKRKIQHNQLSKLYVKSFASLLAASTLLSSPITASDLPKISGSNDANLNQITSTLSVQPYSSLEIAEETSTPQRMPLKGYQTREGLIYFDFKEPDPNLPTPRYGDLVSFYYSLYYQAGLDKDLVLIDSNFKTSEPFLNKLGNGRVIKGMDDALHTMTVGSRRRLIIPLNLGYNRFALGPLPVKPENRRALSKYLTLVEQNKGKFVADVELAYIGEDENDQGYYDDIPVTNDEIRALADEVKQKLDMKKPTRIPEA